MARYFQMADGNFAAWDNSLDNQSAPLGWTLIATYDHTLYAVIHQQLSDNTKNATWNAVARTLTINSAIVIDGAWIDSEAARLATAVATVSAKSGLKDKISLAQTHADAIRRIFNTVLDQTINQTAQPTRWNNIKAQIDNAATANAFKNRFGTDVLEELGFDVNGALSAAQIRQVTLYSRMWIAGLALLLSEA